ncbi:MAG: hypothetical protein JWM11_6382, partial [Planctomycetaceae bacterium]|nr:hypothetical protein [Planctomycetaceae bacterium]
ATIDQRPLNKPTLLPHPRNTSLRHVHPALPYHLSCRPQNQYACLLFSSAENSTSESSDWIDSPVILVAVGIAGFMVLEHRKQRRRSGIGTRQKHHSRSTLRISSIPTPDNKLATSTSSKSQNDKLTRSANDPTMTLMQANLDTDERLDKSQGDLLSQSSSEQDSNKAIEDELFTDLAFAIQNLDRPPELLGTQWEAKTQPTTRFDWDAEEASSPNSPVFSPGVIWLVACLLLAIGSFVPTFSWRELSNNQATAAVPFTEVSGPRLKYREIQDIRTGMRVVAENPELVGKNIPQSDIQLETWRNVSLRMDKPDGGELLVTLLRSVDWLREQQAEAAGTIRLQFPELGIDGPAKVLSIAPCPTIEPGEGRVVTGTFRHSSADVIDLYVSSETKPIGATRNHPFWSETRQKFVPAGRLNKNELLRTELGETCKVEKLAFQVRQYSVYNLEVDAEHCYTIGSSGIVVHNSNNYNVAPPPGAGNVLKNLKSIPWGQYCENGCEKVAKRISQRVGGTIQKITPRTGRLLGDRGTIATGWRHHVVVVKDGRVYDAMTGPYGLSIEDFKNCWENADDIEFGF